MEVTGEDYLLQHIYQQLTTAQIFPKDYELLGRDRTLISRTWYIISTINHQFYHRLWTKFSKVRDRRRNYSQSKNQCTCVVSLWTNNQPLDYQHQYSTLKTPPFNDVFYQKILQKLGKWLLLTINWSGSIGNNFKEYWVENE